MSRPFVILFISLFLLGCGDQGVEPERAAISPIDAFEAAVPGVVGVFFVEGTTQLQAEQLVSNLGLSFKSSPNGVPLLGLVTVPTGSEDEWVKRFKEYDIVKNADRVWSIRIT